MLRGPELLSKLKELGNASKSEVVRACGYVTPKQGGGDRLNYTAFYEALLEAKGMSFGGTESKRIDHTGRKLRYISKVHFNGNLLIGKAYTSMLGLKPGDEFDIKLERKGIRLIPKGRSGDLAPFESEVLTNGPLTPAIALDVDGDNATIDPIKPLDNESVTQAEVEPTRSADADSQLTLSKPAQTSSYALQSTADKGEAATTSDTADHETSTAPAPASPALPTPTVPPSPMAATPVPVPVSSTPSRSTMPAPEELPSPVQSQSSSPEKADDPLSPSPSMAATPVPVSSTPSRSTMSTPEELPSPVQSQSSSPEKADDPLSPSPPMAATPVPVPSSTSSQSTMPTPEELPSPAQSQSSSPDKADDPLNPPPPKSPSLLDFNFSREYNNSSTTLEKLRGEGNIGLSGDLWESALQQIDSSGDDRWDM